MRKGVTPALISTTSTVTATSAARVTMGGAATALPSEPWTTAATR